MKTVIRIEHTKDGRGLFRSGTAHNRTIEKLYCHDALLGKHSGFPTPFHDNLINRRPKRNEYCAFKSIEQLQEWLESDWIKEAIKFGYRVLMLDVSEYVEGEYQILYKRCNVLQSKDVSSLFI